MNVLSGYGSSDEDGQGSAAQPQDLMHLKKKIRVEAAPAVLDLVCADFQAVCADMLNALGCQLLQTPPSVGEVLSSV
jgi:hypothetical protein